MDKQLKDKAIDLNHKMYVQVKDRVIYFNETYPNGAIHTKIVSYENNQIIIKATVYPDYEKPERYFTGYAQEVEGDSLVNKTSALENAETSAVGRALAFMGIGVIDGIASVDEIHKAENTGIATDKQINYANSLIPRKTGKLPDQFYTERGIDNTTMSMQQAKRLINELLNMEDKK